MRPAGRSIGGERLGRFGFICVPSTLRGHAGERAFHFLLNALHRAGADATLAGNLQDAFTGAQLSLDALFDRGIDPRPAELACVPLPQVAMSALCHKADIPRVSFDVRFWG
jgi:hypothetical protein